MYVHDKRSTKTELKKNSLIAVIFRRNNHEIFYFFFVQLTQTVSANNSTQIFAELMTSRFAI